MVGQITPLHRDCKVSLATALQYSRCRYMYVAMQNSGTRDGGWATLPENNQSTEVILRPVPSSSASGYKTACTPGYKNM